MNSISRTPITIFLSTAIAMTIGTNSHGSDPSRNDRINTPKGTFLETTKNPIKMFKERRQTHPLETTVLCSGISVTWLMVAIAFMPASRISLFKTPRKSNLTLLALGISTPVVYYLHKEKYISFPNFSKKFNPADESQE